jgi:hypothetical protein
MKTIILSEPELVELLENAVQRTVEVVFARQKAGTPEKCYSLYEVHKKTGISYNCLRRHANEGLLTLTAGRKITESELKKYLKNN